MATETEVRLKQAFELIELDQLDKAEGLLKPLLESDKDNPDVWWLYAHTVKDVDTARSALYTVLRLDKQYPDAAELLTQLESPPPATSEWLPDSPLAEPSFLPGLKSPDASRSNTLISFAPKSTPPPPDFPEAEPASDFEDDLDLPDPDEGDEENDEENKPGVRRPIFLVALMGFLVLLAVALVLVITKPFGKSDTSSPTLPPTAIASSVDTTPQSQTESSPTLPPTAIASSVDATPETPTESTSASNLELDLALSQFTVAPNGIAIQNTRMGQTVVASICAENQSGTGLRQTLSTVMDVLAKNAEQYTDRAQAIGTELYDCQNNRILRAIGVAIGDAISYSDGTLDANSFQSRWQPIA